MKPVAFPSYEQRHALAALALLSESAVFCKVTAGGQSLGPILNLACAAGCPDRHQPTGADMIPRIRDSFANTLSPRDRGARRVVFTGAGLCHVTKTTSVQSHKPCHERRGRATHGGYRRELGKCRIL
jgi:hypothetical protein